MSETIPRLPGSPAGTIGPHKGREIELMLAGLKPAAILERFKGRPPHLPNLPFGLVGRWHVERDEYEGDLWRCLAAVDHEALDTLALALDHGGPLEIGLALGYTPADVRAFIAQDSQRAKYATMPPEIPDELAKPGMLRAFLERCAERDAA